MLCGFATHTTLARVFASTLAFMLLVHFPLVTHHCAVACAWFANAALFGMTGRLVQLLALWSSSERVNTALAPGLATLTALTSFQLTAESMAEDVWFSILAMRNLARLTLSIESAKSAQQLDWAHMAAQALPQLRGLTVCLKRTVLLANAARASCALLCAKKCTVSMTASL